MDVRSEQKRASLEREEWTRSKTQPTANDDVCLCVSVCLVLWVRGEWRVMRVVSAELCCTEGYASKFQVQLYCASGKASADVNSPRRPLSKTSLCPPYSLQKFAFSGKDELTMRTTDSR